MNTTLRVHSIESFGTHDGPGIRMVIFLQGCNIKCLYCQNADTIPTSGGTEHTIDDIVARAVRMKGYFGKEGGVTLSGGEPLLQAKALVPLFKKLKAEGIHTNIDTNATLVNEATKELVEKSADLLMFDLKHANANGFEKLVGKPLYEASERLINLREKSNKPFWFRYVLVPGYTDSIEDLQRIGQKYGGYQNLQRFQILPYHKLGKYKWEALGEKYLLESTPENTPDQIEIAKNTLEKYFKHVVV